MEKNFLSLLNNLLYSYSTLLFIRSKSTGFVLLLITCLNLNLAVTGILSWAIAIFFAHLISIKKEDKIHIIYTYNALIVGFSIGFLFKITFLSILLTIGTSILTVLISYTLFSLLSKTIRLPVLNSPFFIVSTIIYLASTRYSSLFVDSFYLHE
ncbi:MAG: urea transporter, partial [Desulfobacterales bacterium]|nr:urea transporter [Desulfobacterales bacterium]